MEAFIMETFMEKEVTINCGGGDVFSGIVDSCMNKVLTLKKPEGIVYINLEKIVSITQNKN